MTEAARCIRRGDSCIPHPERVLNTACICGLHCFPADARCETVLLSTKERVVLVYEIRRYAQSDYNCCSLPVQHCDAVHDSVSVGT